LCSRWLLTLVLVQRSLFVGKTRTGLLVAV
jgi:hypothetical protein